MKLLVMVDRNINRTLIELRAHEGTSGIVEQYSSIHLTIGSAKDLRDALNRALEFIESDTFTPIAIEMED